MSSPNFGPTRDNTASVVSFYRMVLEGKYLARFNEQADSLSYYGAMTLGGELFEMQKFDPGDDCDCAGPNDRPGCPVCAQAEAQAYGLPDMRMASSHPDYKEF